MILNVRSHPSYDTNIKIISPELCTALMKRGPGPCQLEAPLPIRLTTPPYRRRWLKEHPFQLLDLLV